MAFSSALNCSESLAEGAPVFSHHSAKGGRCCP